MGTKGDPDGGPADCGPVRLRRSVFHGGRLREARAALSGSQALQSGDGSACSMERSCAVLYIGVGNQFAEYPVEYTGELDENGQIPPEEVVSAMASLTGWSLDLAEPIFSGKGGITVSFADTSALFVGPPEEQRRSSVFMTPSSWTRRFWTA